MSSRRTATRHTPARTDRSRSSSGVGRSGDDYRSSSGVGRSGRRRYEPRSDERAGSKRPRDPPNTAATDSHNAKRVKTTTNQQSSGVQNGMDEAEKQRLEDERYRKQLELELQISGMDGFVAVTTTSTTSQHKPHHSSATRKHNPAPSAASSGRRDVPDAPKKPHSVPTVAPKSQSQVTSAPPPHASQTSRPTALHSTAVKHTPIAKTSSRTSAPETKASVGSSDGVDSGDESDMFAVSDEESDDDTTNRQAAERKNRILLHPGGTDSGHQSTNGDVEKKTSVVSASLTRTSVLQFIAETRRLLQTKHLSANFDDKEGYYVFKFGDVMGGQYLVEKMQGKGSYASVFRVLELPTDLQFATDDNKTPTSSLPTTSTTTSTEPSNWTRRVVKVSRSQHALRMAARAEQKVLRLLRDKDPDGKCFTVRYLHSFEHRGHLCLVFEAMHGNLRELLKSIGGTGVRLKAVSVWARQLLTGLAFLHSLKLVHADIKPDNLLYSADHGQVKVADLGSCAREGQVPPHPELVSRFYRPPEVCLGVYPLTTAVDMWSLGCVLFELYTGKIAFRGADNNGMLAEFQRHFGPVHNRLLKQGTLTSQHFKKIGKQSRFVEMRTEQFEGGGVVAVERVFGTRGDDNGTILSTRLWAAAPPSDRQPGSPGHRKLTQFAELLRGIFQFRPDVRLTPAQALRHPFFTQPFQ